MTKPADYGIGPPPRRPGRPPPQVGHRLVTRAGNAHTGSDPCRTASSLAAPVRLSPQPSRKEAL